MNWVYLWRLIVGCQARPGLATGQWRLANGGRGKSEFAVLPKSLLSLEAFSCLISFLLQPLLRHLDIFFHLLLLLLVSPNIHSTVARRHFTLVESRKSYKIVRSTTSLIAAIFTKLYPLRSFLSISSCDPQPSTCSSNPPQPLHSSPASPLRRRSILLQTPPSTSVRCLSPTKVSIYRSVDGGLQD